ncbi:peptide methionine sulfoxide reductase msrb [Plakobranchus ocellatus]|uniref:Peptide-methionine (R)-S-oxide reductase n=1 Tax=Plakobranchus ocellatus TaxID=259542 RepID=A0AAV3Z2D5_9GAST|nr:peptide methionine sulfoxide reductase msrb [Plakobranchus ocellatus]
MGDMHSQEVNGLADTTQEARPGKITKTDAEWKQTLTPEQYSVCRRQGTERAFTGVLLDNKKKGVYICAACHTELFSSSAKFDSGSGWPSFYDVLKDKDVSKLPAVDIRQDISHGMRRTEVLCGKCGSHLGHVFNDGPNPTGLRYCINSVSLGFKEGGSSGGSTSGN